MPRNNNNNRQTNQFVSGHLPYSESSEQYLIGACLLDRGCLHEVINSVTEDSFYIDKHKDIYRAIKNLYDNDNDVNIQSVTAKLEEFKSIDRVGGADYLNTCADQVTSTLTLQYNLSEVINNEVLRNMLTTMREIDYQCGTEEIEDLDEYIAHAEEVIRTAAGKRASPYFKKASDVTSEVQEELSELEKRKNTDDDEVIGVNTGFQSINKLTQGFKKGEVTIIGARPSVGKTALTLTFAYNAAIFSHVSVAIFSLEMDRRSLIKRLAASQSLVNLQSINAGTIQGVDKEKFNDALEGLAQTPIYIDDTSGENLINIENKARKLKASDPNLGLIIIDYLGLIATTEAYRSNNDNRQEEVRKISAAVKNLARSLDLPIILVSQLSRSVDERGGDHIPQLSDLRESGAIEQDADVVMLLYRPDYYTKGRPSGLKRSENLSVEEQWLVAQEERDRQGKTDPAGTSLITVNVAKNRNGQTGLVRLYFQKAYGRFTMVEDNFEQSFASADTSYED